MALVCVGGCSPMYQSVYDGDVRFEHCYRVDEERHVATTEKLQCWRDWTQRFHYGQSRDRISYAQARERTLAQAIAAGQEAPRGASEAQKRTIPQPRSLYAPPPPTLAPASLETGKASDGLRLAGDTASNDAGAEEHPRSLAASATNESYTSLADAPGASCAGACVKTWSSCKQPCKAGACRTSCDESYRTCMKACF